VVDLNSKTPLKEIRFAKWAASLRFTPDGNQVCAFADGKVITFDAQTHSKLDSTNVAFFAVQPALSSAGDWLYPPLSGAEVAKVSTSDFLVAASITVTGSFPSSVAISSDPSVGYVSCRGTWSVSKIDLEQATELEHIELAFPGTQPKKLALAPQNPSTNLAHDSSPHVAAAYPNPFRSCLHLPIYLVRPGLVSVRICDLSGREVFRSTVQVSQAGHHQIDWQTPTQASQAMSEGIYQVIWQAEGQVFTQMVCYQPSK